MANTDNIDNIQYQHNNPGDKDLIPVKRSFKEPWINLGIPILQFLMGLFGIVISLSLLMIAYTQNQKRINEVQESVSSLNMLIDSLRTHANKAYKSNNLMRTDIKYDTIIIPHTIIEDLNKIRTPGNQK